MKDEYHIKGALHLYVYDRVVSPETLKYTSPVSENLVTTVGKNYFAQDASSSRPTAITGFLVGNGSTAAAVGDTNLSGASKYRQAFDSSTSSANVTTFTTTIAAGNATFNNNEFGITNATSTALSDGVLITHLIAGPYNKGATDVFVYVYTLTVN